MHNKYAGLFDFMKSKPAPAPTPDPSVMTKTVNAVKDFYGKHKTGIHYGAGGLGAAAVLTAMLASRRKKD